VTRANTDAGFGAQYFLERLAACQLIDELVEVADLLHEGILDLLDAHTTDDARDERDVRVDVGVAKELLERRLAGKLVG
jgi:hypothetical protein